MDRTEEDDWDNFFVTLREEWERKTANPDDEAEFQRFLFVTTHIIYNFLCNEEWNNN
tara:strand:+ start:556 stop:726 length:171 start_codon:yes stop_codon:yes gene_type:complete